MIARELEVFPYWSDFVIKYPADRHKVNPYPTPGS